MPGLARTLSLCFAAGAFGALVQSLGLVAAGGEAERERAGQPVHAVRYEARSSV